MKAIFPTGVADHRVDMKWLAAHRHLRSAANASHQIRRHRQQPPKLPKALQRWIIQSKNVA